LILIQLDDSIGFLRELVQEIFSKRVKVAVAKDISDNPDLPLEKTLSECQGKVTTYLKSDTLYASDFVVSKKQIKQDWGFTYGFYSIERLKREIANKSILDNIRNAKGILAYVLCETPEEHRDLQEEIPILINNADLKVRERVAIALPKTSIGDVGENILMIKRLTELSSAKADGQAYSNCYEQLTSHVEKELTSLLRNVIVYSHLDHKLTSDVRQNPQGVISELLSDLYPLVPTLEACDKMRTGHITGRKTVMLILKQLFADTFSPHSFKQEDLNIIEPVFIRGWGLFGKIRDIYEVRIPTNSTVRKAWETIDELAGLGVWSERYISLKVIWQKLSEPPYGYSDLAFVVLLAAWLHHHRYEISIKGTQDPKKASIKQEMSLKQWANTELVNSKPDIFVGKWIEVQDAQIYRTKVKSLADLPTAPMPFSVAQDYLNILQDFLSGEDIDPKQRQEVQSRFDNLSKQLDPYVIWLEPVLAIEELQRTALYAFTRLIDLKHAIDSRQLPPAPRLGDPYAIQRTENEVQRHDNAKSWLESTIQFEIDKHLGSLDTVIDPGNILAFQSQTEKMLGDIQELHQFPPTWIQVLEQGITAAQIKEADLKKTAELINAKAQIQDLCGLHSRSTEDDYENAIKKIQAIGEINPVVREERIYQDSLDGLESCLSLLSNQIIRWRQQSHELNQTEALLTLSREIASHKSRYKKPEHLEIIRQVEEQVKQKIVEGNTQDKKREAEENIYQLEQKVGQVYTLVEGERPKAADKILTELKRLDYQYADVITNGFLPRLEEIKRVCQQELDKDVAAKIKLDFQKLPPSIRQQLIQELTQLSQV
ncbi:MAG: hypothetical protein HC921_20280, partial [Synechococcaceae cyanobacterium SM2_3_1]|nr:hypothetical protein [Synechococcaceae cyanobacterium SM2_3_1]